MRGTELSLQYVQYVRNWVKHILSIGLVIFGMRYSSFYTNTVNSMTEQTGRGRGERRGVPSLRGSDIFRRLWRLWRRSRRRPRRKLQRQLRRLWYRRQTWPRQRKGRWRRQRRQRRLPPLLAIPSHRPTHSQFINCLSVFLYQKSMSHYVCIRKNGYAVYSNRIFKKSHKSVGPPLGLINNWRRRHIPWGRCPLVCRACMHSFFIGCQSSRELRITSILRDAAI